MSIRKVGFTAIDVINAQNGSRSFKSVDENQVIKLAGVAVDDGAVDKKTGELITITYLKDENTGDIYGGNSQNVRMTAECIIDAVEHNELSLPLLARFSVRTSKNGKEFISLLVSEMGN